ncbi:MAG: GTP 3',8-cyclase MoaA [Desulfovibrionaceae bacterium]
MLVDKRGRKISYLRLSVTDRCNLRCQYCTGGIKNFIRHEDVLRYEEMRNLIHAATELGVAKVRLTGGEPFVRRGFCEFVTDVLAENPGLDLRITTNGTLLAGKLEPLRKAGLKRLNISLDSLQRERFARITGHDLFPEVHAAIMQALELDYQVKINAVGMRGVNDDELEAFLNLAYEHPIDVRYIEFMPMGGCGRWGEDAVWPSEKILERAREITPLEESVDTEITRGPARLFRIVGGKGRLGLISPLSGHICANCNRLRVTSDGRLRTCLFSDREFRLRPTLRHPRLGLKYATEIMRRATLDKPLGEELLRARMKDELVCAKGMLSIGG